MEETVKEIGSTLIGVLEHLMVAALIISFSGSHVIERWRGKRISATPQDTRQDQLVKALVSTTRRMDQLTGSLNDLANGVREWERVSTDRLARIEKQLNRRERYR